MAELSTLARPYAKAAFEYAVEAKDLQGWSDSLALAASVAQQSAVEKLLSSPSATAAMQAEAVQDIYVWIYQMIAHKTRVSSKPLAVVMERQ